MNKEKLIEAITKLFNEALEEETKEFNRLLDEYFYGGGIEKDYPEFYRKNIKNGTHGK